MSYGIEVPAIALHVGDVFDRTSVVTKIEVFPNRVDIYYRKAGFDGVNPCLARFVRSEERNTPYRVEREQ